MIVPVWGMTLINMVILILNCFIGAATILIVLKMYTEILKDKSQDRRMEGDNEDS